MSYYPSKMLFLENFESQYSTKIRSQSFFVKFEEKFLKV